MKKTIIALMALAGVASATEYTLTTEWLDLPNTVEDFYSGDYSFSFTLNEGFTLENTGSVLAAYWGKNPQADAGVCAIVLSQGSEGSYTLTIGRGKLNKTPSNAIIPEGTSFTVNTSYSAQNGNPNSVSFENIIKEGVTYTVNVKGGNHNMEATVSWKGGSTDTLAYSGNMVQGDKNQFMNYAKNNGVVAPAIPEPTTATLSLLALAGLAARRRRR